MNLIFLLILIFVTSIVVCAGIINLVFKDRKLIQARLAELVKSDDRELLDEDLNKPFRERAIYPLLKLLSNKFSKVMPETRVKLLQQKLLYAGTPGNLTSSEFLGIQYSLALGLPLLVSLILIPSPVETSTVFMIGSSMLAVGYFLPLLHLKSRSEKRKEEIEKSLPDVLDLLTVSVEAGLGFDAAMGKVSAKAKGPLGNEFLKVLQEIKMGKPRRDALKDLTNRCDSEGLANFISSLLQADQLGVSIGGVLRLQADQMRQTKRQLVEEKAMKAPVKMLIPLVLFIFPTLFIVLLGPAAIQIFQTLID